MRPKSLLLIVIALGCGLVASIGISQVLENKNGEQGAPTLETEQVYVALVDIPTGEPLTADLVQREPWPKGRVPAGAITNLDELIDRRPRSPLIAGEVILAAKLIDPNAPDGASGDIPPGYRVFPLVISTGDSPTGLVLPGDRVDVLCFFRASREIPEPMTRTILRDVMVFAVNEQTTRMADQDNSVINAKTVSLLITPQQNRILMLASELGKLRISLRRAGDDEVDNGDEVTLSDLIDADTNEDGFNVDRPEEPAQDEFVQFLTEQDTSAPAVPAKTWTMQIMTPTEVSSYEWEDAESDSLPRPAATPTADSFDSGLPMGTPASDPDITRGEYGEGDVLDITDGDYEQVQQMLEQGNLDIE